MSPEAYAKQLKINREWKEHQRATNPQFVAAERASRKRYKKRLQQFSRRARLFVRDHRQVFEQWLKDHDKGITVASPATQSQRTLRTIPAPMPSHAPAQWRMSTTSGVIPSAAAMESRRLKSAGNNRLA